MRSLIFLNLLVVVFTGPVLGDQIILRNGDRLSGAIVKSDTENLQINSEFAGLVKVQWAAIEGIQSTEPLYVTLKDEQLLVGLLATRDGRIEIQTAEAGRVALSKEVIRSMRSRQEQAAYQAEIERLKKPRLRDSWSGSFDSGLSATRGNADTLTFSAGMNAARTTSRDKISTYVTSLFARNSTSGVSITTAQATRGGARFDINLSERVFTFAFTDLEYDKFQRLDLRNVVGGGLGWHARKTERTTFDVFGGGSFNQEFFANDLTRRSGELLAGEELFHKISGSTSIRQRLVFYPNLSQTGEFRIAFDVGAVTQLSKWLGWQISVSDRYLSNPIPGTQKNDLLLTTGIRVLFGGGAF